MTNNRVNIGDHTSVYEDEDGNTIVENTETNQEIRLEDSVVVVQADKVNITDEITTGGQITMGSGGFPITWEVGAGGDTGPEITASDTDTVLISDNLQLESISASGPYYQEVVSETTGSSITIDVSENDAFNLVVDDDTTIDISGSGAGKDGEGLSIFIEGSGSNNISWDSDVDWGDRSGVDEISDGEQIEVTIRTYDGGNKWIATESWRSE